MSPATQQVTLPPVPAVVDSRVSHSRVHPQPYSFTSRIQYWLVDLDHLPRGRWLRAFRAEDHFDRGSAGQGIRGDLVRFMTRRGVAVAADDRLLMLASPRQWGHTFNPLSVHWCLRSDGSVRAAVLEVHNTYGERHAYLVRPDSAGHAVADKAFYVSPFNDTHGQYRVHLTLTPEAVSVQVDLDRDGRRIFSAHTTGHPVPATSRAVARLALTRPLDTLRVSAAIRWHGIRLWASRLPIAPRTPHSQEAVR